MLVTDAAITPLAAADLNLPSVAFSRFTGFGSTVRTFTSVDRQPQSWAGDGRSAGRRPRPRWRPPASTSLPGRPRP